MIRLRRIEPGLYETLDRRFRLERVFWIGTRGGKIPVWWISGTNGTAACMPLLPLEPGPYRSLADVRLAVAPHVRGWSGLSQESGTVYLIHFDQPFGHARHYLGWTNRQSVAERLAEHRASQGANLLKHVNAAGIGYQVVRIWPGGRRRERQLKKQGGASRLCPVCKHHHKEN